MNLEPFHIVGVSIRTSNEKAKSSQDIARLWQKFLSEKLMDKIPDKLESAIYSVYTEYAGDHTKPYTVIIGCKVPNLNQIPAGMVGKTVPGGRFAKFVAQGDQSAVYQEWVKIWQAPLKRRYIADFEVYGPKSRDLKMGEVDIYISVE